MSARKEIRKKIGEILMLNTAAGANVFVSRTRKISASSLPAILVYTRQETAEEFNTAPRELKRTLTVGIEIVARADDELDDTLDDLAQEVERIMSENQLLADDDGDPESERCSDIAYTGAEITLTGDGDNQHGACVLSYDVTYYTKDVSEGVAGAGVPSHVVLTPFETAGVEWRVPPFNDTQPETQDEISLPQ